MTRPPTDDLAHAADRLEAALRDADARWAKAVEIVPEAESTQDEALARASGSSGLVLIAERQRGGRGRLGRVWADDRGLGLAMTIVLRNVRPEHLAIASGVAACRAIESLIGNDVDAYAHVGLRWPNDAVVRSGPLEPRKLAGVLIEKRENLTLLGIGVNVMQGEGDWPDELRTRAASVRQLADTVDLARPITRADVAEALLRELSAMIRSDDDTLAWHAQRADVLRGSTRTFTSAGRTFTGHVERILPTRGIVLRLDDGSEVELPAATTSLVHDAGA